MTVFAPESIKQVQRNKLKPYKNNPRVHSEAQIDRLVRSFKEFGFTNPILVDKNLNVIAGHGRLMAAEVLDLETVPIISLEHLDDEQRKAYIIADNHLAISSGWDDDLLQEELKTLGELGFDLTVLGWGDDLPTFGEEIDLSALEDEEEDLSDFAAGVRRSIMIDFEIEDYEEAQTLVNAARKKGEYVGMKLIEALR